MQKESIDEIMFKDSDYEYNKADFTDSDHGLSRISIYSKAYRRPWMAQSVPKQYLHISPQQVIDCNEGTSFKPILPIPTQLNTSQPNIKNAKSWHILTTKAG